jgi:septal ring factor EnvC (AmiA/AmiB activator)
MGLQANAATAQPTAQDLNDAYSALLDDLNDAYWAANSMEAKDQLYGFIELITCLITQLDAADLASRDDQYAALVKQVAAVNKQLDNLQAQINSLISRINTSANIVSDVAKAISIAGSVLTAV